MVEGVEVDLAGEGESGAAGLGEADDLLEPGGSGGLEVDAGAGALEGASDDGVERELVGAGVDAELEVGGEAVAGDGPGDDGEVVVEFAFELGEVTDVIHALVEPAGELRRDGLDGDLFVGQGGEDDREGGRRLGFVGLVHGDFGDEVARALLRLDVAVDAAGLGDGLEEAGGVARDLVAGGADGFGGAGDGDGADEFGVAVDEGVDLTGFRGAADAVGDVDGEEVGVGQEAVDGLESDVVGVDVPGVFPVEGLHGGLGGGEDGGGFGSDEGVFAVGLVPDRDDGEAVLGDLGAGLELGLGLVGEAVAGADGVTCELEHGRWGVGWERGQWKVGGNARDEARRKPLAERMRAGGAVRTCDDVMCAATSRFPLVWGIAGRGSTGVFGEGWVSSHSDMGPATARCGVAMSSSPLEWALERRRGRRLPFVADEVTRQVSGFKLASSDLKLGTPSTASSRRLLRSIHGGGRLKSGRVRPDPSSAGGLRQVG